MTRLARLPVIEHDLAPPTPSGLARADRLAAQLLRAEPALANTSYFGPNVCSGLGEGPVLAFEDHSEIALFDRRGDSALQYRALLLASDGDVVLIGGRRNVAFEAYCRDTLALGAASVVSLPGPKRRSARSLAQRCAASLDASSPILQKAQRHRRLTVLPYIGTGTAWQLAGQIAARTGARVMVAAPPPRLTRRVNDKLWFAGRAQDLLGREALPPSYHAFGPAALAGRVAVLARRFERVVIKVPDSAGSAGNLVLEARNVRPLRLHELRHWLLQLLRNLGWRKRFPLMVGVWDCNVAGSPSVQVWIPRTEDGLPVVEGIFDQIVEGDVGAFVGAVPSSAPAEWRQRLAQEATLLARLFQRLGYFGRCSFDAVLVGASESPTDLHWIECNGRWGGTSIPMTLANRLVGDWTRRSFMVVQRTGLSNQPRQLPAVLEQLGSLVFRAGSRDSGVVLLTPGGLEEGTGMHFLLLGRGECELRRQLEALEALPGAPGDGAD